MNWRRLLPLGLMMTLSVILLACAHFVEEPTWFKENLPIADGGAATLWQVQTTFLSVGFAGLAIAAQLFAEAPLAIGASRGRVLEFIHAGLFAGFGLAANAVIAVATLWLPSSTGVVGVALVWFAPTIVLLVISAVKLMQLFSRPSQLDEVVRRSLVETLAGRLEDASRHYAEQQNLLDGLTSADSSIESLRALAATLRVPVPQVDSVVKAIHPEQVRRALNSLGPRATPASHPESQTATALDPPQIALGVEPGDRTRIGQTAFRVSTPEELDEATRDRVVRLLQSSIEFEAPGTVTPYEETDRDIATLKDAIGANLRSGAFAAADRALELLGHVICGVWMTAPEALNSSRRTSITRRNWLFRSFAEVEQDALLSPRAAGLFVSAAMNRALEAPSVGSREYVDECLRSFVRIWKDVLQYGGPEFNHLPDRIVTCVQNLAAYSYPTSDHSGEHSVRATWAMVELIKLAIDAKRPQAAVLAATELSGLFRYSDPTGACRAQVRAGQLVLSAWQDYLADKGDERAAFADPRLRAVTTPHGTRAEVLAARRLADGAATPFTRWDWWEMELSPSSEAKVLELSHYVDRAQLAALATSYGPIPPACDEETASEYKRLLGIFEEETELSRRELKLKEELVEQIDLWEAAEDERLAAEPLSEERIEALQAALVETLATGDRLASVIPVMRDIPESANQAEPILGMNFRVPRHYLVDKVFHQTYADPKELGRLIARGFIDGEEHKLIDNLRELQMKVLEPSSQAISDQVISLGEETEHYVLLTPYGGFPDSGWYSRAFQDVLARVAHVQTGLLDGEAILFDRRTTLLTARTPETKEGLTPVDETTIALGVFEDVAGVDEPTVRIEAGEYFVVWAGEDPRIFHFSSTTAAEVDEERPADELGDPPS